ncbi:unnamed protein product [Echinostoma caproni]|uniref:Integrase catalytic domain-containing protein n=1 Tax=Echinostoma caproni TaxID=27848 RepID=A0A183AAZ9_9TREM|nr:unnamed protein product [Echinostoma caproni]
MDVLQRIYDTEFSDLHSVDQAPSVEDAEALRIVENGTQFIGGHFEVPLLWERGANTGSGNYESVLVRLNQLKGRLTRDETLRNRYAKAMKLMIDKGYASPVPAYKLHEEYQPKWYLPHHAVINSKNPDKIRIVLDCAANHMGSSLNSMVLQGPDITANFVSILLRFRKERIALMADIEEMFMQVKVPEEDRGALRFLCWTGGDMNEQIKEFQMVWHPLGTTSSPPSVLTSRCAKPPQPLGCSTIGQSLRR